MKYKLINQNLLQIKSKLQSLNFLRERLEFNYYNLITRIFFNKLNYIQI
jgi:hypothetical protein